ncbi:MAG TPA: thiamine pyrophosphate-dependent dehydrogenase E1 component subunit alpha, partial [Sphingomicrobium sp.]|nr:thiamine pyrophosphate-dependent dehydrogenase E1 component subunit alpha [Sphingomicrobium sp.]
MADRDPGRVSAEVDWREVVRLVLTSREMDRIEEQELVPQKKVLYQFSARGHDVAQVLLGLHLKDGDGVFGYYRSRPLLLSLGVPLADALGSGMGLAGGYSNGRDIGVVFNYPNPGGAHALPMCGGVGAQYTPAAGWAQAIAYKQKILKEGPSDAISLVLGGDASAATGGFWSALTITTTQSLPLLIYIEDNGYGISVPSQYQTPGKDIAANLASFSGLTIFNGDGTDPVEASKLVHDAVQHVRTQRTPALLRLTVPRLEGHSAQDTQAYKSEEEIEAEWARDPLPKLKAHVAKLQIGDDQWSTLEQETAWQVQAAVAEAEARGVSSPEAVTSSVFYEGQMQEVGGLWNSGYEPPASTDEPHPDGQRINMVTAIRR